jgi:predicted nucleic acid-binding protein
VTYLIDTNVISELREEGSGKADRCVVSWAKSVDRTSVFLSVMTVQELELGTLRMERQDASQGRLLRNWPDKQVLPSFAGRVLPVDLPVALRCAALHVPNPVAERDALIAATALVHGMTIVTRNSADLASTGARLFNLARLTEAHRIHRAESSTRAARSSACVRTISCCAATPAFFASIASFTPGITTAA